MSALQRYISDELTHFVGRRFRDLPDAHERQFSLLVDILRQGRLGASPDVAMTPDTDRRLSDNDYYKSNVVCFSDIPVPDLGIHMGKFSRFGLAFRKSLLVGRGANPVYYVAKNAAAGQEGGSATSLAQLFDQRHEQVMEFFNRVRPNGDDEVRELLRFLVFHFFAFVKFYDEGLAADDQANFYMEREWRIYGSLTFGLADVRRVIFPERFARRFRQEVPDYYGEITFS